MPIAVYNFRDLPPYYVEIEFAMWLVHTFDFLCSCSSARFWETGPTNLIKQRHCYVKEKQVPGHMSEEPIITVIVSTNGVDEIMVRV